MLAVPNTDSITMNSICSERRLTISSSAFLSAVSMSSSSSACALWMVFTLFASI